MSRWFAVAGVILAACSASNSASPDGGMMPGDGSGSGSGSGSGVVATHEVQIIVEPNSNHGSELVTAISGATTSIEMTMYQIDNTSVINALTAKARAGVTVRVILDGSSINKSWNMSAYTSLTSAGASVVWSSTSFTYTHEKCVIIDHKTAWIMTMNANTSSPTENREYLAIDTNAGDVAEAKAVFDADFAMHSIAPTGNLVVADNNARQLLVALVNSAKTSVDIEGEEFSDTNSAGVVTSVVAAAKRGCAVRVIVAKDSSPLPAQTQAIASVKTAGGHVVVTGPTSGNGTSSNPYIHAKAAAIDCTGTTCALAFVGSENFSAGSLGYNRELGVIFDTTAEIAKVKAAIDTDFAAGVPQ